MGNKMMESLDAEGRNATTTINAFELFFGAHKSTKKTKNVREVFKLLDRLDVFDFTLEASEVAGEITAILENEGKMQDFRDIMIASIVKCHGMTLVTRNADHFRYLACAFKASSDRTIHASLRIVW